MSRSVRFYLQDIVIGCEKILRYTQGMTYDEFLADELTYDAVIRNFQILGEAIKNVPNDLRERYPCIEWRRIAGLRDIVSHAYFQVDDDIIWNLIQHRVAELKEQIQQILMLEFNEQ